MATQVKLRSREQILGDMVRTVSIDTDISDFSRGSDLVTLMEATSEAISQTEASALKILESQDLNALVGNSLDKKAISLRIPDGQGGFGRKPATQASGPVTIGSGFSKISSKLYSGKPSPFAGGTVLYVENASEFPATGSIYIGRGTLDRFEGAIPYTTVTNNGSFWSIALTDPLTKSHLQSDLVTLAQGGNRSVPAGTTVQIPANNESPPISFTTTESILIPDGEAEGVVNVICSAFGLSGNALAGAIKSFSNIPFSGATVTNKTTFRNGQSVENDEDLRLRIKNYPFTLSRGTNNAIKSAIQGTVDPETGRSIQSSTILDPVEPGDFARVFIDDGTGLEPTFDNQAYELLLKSATGVETRHKTTQFPIVSVMIEGSQSAPFALSAGMSITIGVDGLSEIYSITPSNYKNLSAATAYEIVRDLNSQSNTIGFRTLDDGTRIVGIDLSGNAESILVQSGDLQEVIGFPTSELRTIFLYKNSELISFRGHTATLETRARNLWNITQADVTDVRVMVDNVTQEFSITDADFSEFDSTIATATVVAWATVLSRKIAGVKFTNSGQILTFSSYNSFSPTGRLEILTTKADGSPAGWIGDDKVWLSESSGGILVDVGASKDFNFNRFSGEINLLSRPEEGDTLEIATADTRAFKRTLISETGLFALDPSPATIDNSKLILGFDGVFAVRSVSVASGLEVTPSEPDPVGAANVIRLTANDAGLFSNSVVGDYFYLLSDASAVGNIIPTATESLYRIIARGFSTTAANVAYPGLFGNTQTYSAVTINVTEDSSEVKVNVTNHGLRTGDLITTSQVGAVGGISGAGLIVVDQPIVVLSANIFTYTAGAVATTTTSGTLDTFGHNLILVEHTDHGFDSGALVDVSVGAGFGGISALNLSVSNAEIQKIDDNSYYYRALSAATSTTSNQTITSVTYLPDTWVEFEISDADMAVWSPTLGTNYGVTSNMFHIFKCDDATPQVVDFGALVASENVDDIVTSINDQISGGKTVKFSPQQMEVRSNSFNTGGTVGVLAVIGNSINLFSAPDTDTSIQSHVSFSKSKFVDGGAPVVTSVEVPTDSISGYPTRTYLNIDKNITNIDSNGAIPVISSPTSFNPDYPVGFQHMWVTGKGESFIGRVYNNQTTAPYTGVMTKDDAIAPIGTISDTQTGTNTLDRYSNFGIRLNDIPLNNKDSLIFEMDLDPVDKTVAVPMAKLAEIMDIDTISGSGKGQVISFRLLDPEDADKPFFDSTSVYKDFDFKDLKILTKSVGVYREDASDRALVLRSVDFGGISQLRLSLRFPTQPSQADIAVVHTTDFYNDLARLNLICTLASDPLILNSTFGGGSYVVSFTPNGTIFDMRISAPTLNDGGEYVVGNILNIGGSSVISDSYYISSLTGGVFISPAASTTIGLTTVSVVQVGHGLITGDIITVATSSAIGGITAGQLSVVEAEVTVLSPSVFTYEAPVAASANAAGTLDTVNATVVIVSAPGDAGIISSYFDASVYPITSYPLANKTLIDLETAINEYLPENPIATAEAIGSNLATNYILYPTYEVYQAATVYPNTSMSGAFNHHSFECNLSGSAGIWQYDSSNPVLNNIKATVQTDESIFPTAASVLGTPYTPVGEEVQIVPTNTKSISEWMKFRAVSSLNLLADIERTNNNTVLQVSSKEIGSDGAVLVSGVTANGVESEVITNASSVDDATRITALSANVQSLMPGQLVKVQNAITSAILRAYRDLPSGSSITLANTTDINNYFRAENSIKYIKVSSNTGRLIFLRNGMGSGQVEPLDTGNNITLTNLGGGLVQVTSALGGGGVNSGKLSARTGDMLYIQPISPFDVSARCKPIPSTGRTSPSAPEYIGYPVVHVIDDENVIVIAPNISVFGTTALTSPTDLVFIPAVYNEKNIRTNHQEGAKFDLVTNNGKSWYLIKAIGNGLVSVFLQNSSAEATDTMELEKMSVNTDDYAVFGTGFDPANQGTYKIVAHNGRNHLVVYNPNGGRDELIDLNKIENGGQGGRNWRVGPLEDGIARSLRIISGDSVRIGDYLRISSPSASTQWFNDVFFGSWKISGMGYQALDYTGDALPHTPNDGAYDQSYFAPYIDFDFTNAPVSVTDPNSNPVDSFTIQNNVSSIGFTEQTPYEAFRMVVGHAVNNINPENRDLFVRPKYNVQKISSTFGSQIIGLSKLGFEERVFLGIDGYKIFSGLVRQAHRIIDGLPQNTISFPGVRAAGTIIEVQTPLIRSVSISLQVRPTDGVTLNSITELVKSAVSGYINSLGAGSPVVISEIQRVVQSLPGVFSTSVLSTLPEADDDRIVVSPQEKAYVLDAETDVTIG